MSKFLSISFDNTLREFQISGKKLAEQSGAPASQISEFRNGKRNLSTHQLERVMVAMEELAPGSRLHFCLLAAGSINHRQLAVLLNSVADHLATSQPPELVGTLT